MKIETLKVSELLSEIERLKARVNNTKSENKSLKNAKAALWKEKIELLNRIEELEEANRTKSENEQHY